MLRLVCRDTGEHVAKPAFRLVCKLDSAIGKKTIDEREALEQLLDRKARAAVRPKA
jgi:hypothetical protein